MKSWVWLLLLIAVILIVFGVMAARRPQTTTVPETTATPTETDAAGLLQPVPDGAESPTSTPIPITNEQATVSLTDSGFSPPTLTVSSGTTVTFVNNGQGAHWPASDPHPTHTALAGFDAKRGLTTGESYSFTFTKVGSWNYHDHLNPTVRGTITVR
jgi:plastocyanin